ncbi:MAG: YkgJ family cysteine cluster protein [Pirellulales bacterium]
MAPLKPRFSRSDLKPGECLCDHCSAKCCKYFALHIDKPKTRDDFDLVRWFILHDRATVFTENGVWYLLVYTDCKHLQPNNLCGIYETRPQICRDYSTDNCEFEDDSVYDQYFETSEQLAEYMDARFPPEKGQSIRGPQPALLPILR